MTMSKLAEMNWLWDKPNKAHEQRINAVGMIQWKNYKLHMASMNMVKLKI